jgi:hypothetical protein
MLHTTDQDIAKVNRQQVVGKAHLSLWLWCVQASVKGELIQQTFASVDLSQKGNHTTHSCLSWPN